jgi:hypothetical protein
MYQQSREKKKRVNYNVVAQNGKVSIPGLEGHR